MNKPGKILHLTTSVAGGGAEMMLCNLLEGMHGDDFENVVVVSLNEGDSPFADRMEASSRTFYDLHVRSFKRLSTLISLIRIIRREKPDVIQTWMHKADFFGGIAGRLARVPNVVWGIHARGIYRSPGDSRFKGSLFQAAVGLASRLIPRRIVSCSRTAIQSHREMGYPENKMTWIGNGIDTDRFLPDPNAGQRLRTELGIPAAAPVIGFVGRFAPVKDIPTLLQAVSLLQDSHPGLHVICCGSDVGLQDATIEKHLADLPDRERVHIIPFRPDIEKVYPAFTICTLTSRSEAYPMVLLEAMSCGVPCVSTDAGDARSIIGHTGIVVPVGDALALADAWSLLLSKSPDDFNRLKQDARARCTGNFGLRACVDRYRDLYRELISPAKSS